MTQITLSSKIYADTLIRLGQDGSVSFDEILENLENIQKICASSKELVTVLQNPTISINIKNSIIDEVFSQNIDKKIKDFLKIVIEKKRFNEFNSIVFSFKTELDKINNIKHVEIISAINLDDNTKQTILAKIENKIQKQVIANWAVDNSIIGGLVIKFDDNIIDSSLKQKLEKLSKII